MSGEELQKLRSQSAWGLWSSSFTTVHEAFRVRENHMTEEKADSSCSLHIYKLHVVSPRVGRVGRKETLAAVQDKWFPGGERYLPSLTVAPVGMS